MDLKVPSWLNQVNVGILTGPIFTKECRVSSRRRRYYILRFGFVVLLLLILSLIWMNTVRWRASALNVMAHMASAGKTITGFVIWFEFIICQVVALVSLSTSISDEISRQTLGVLMTTPITSLQIVVGKLLSRLLQLGLLIGITLPILAIIRVFGGVHWHYVLSSLCIILCSSLFVGSISLFFSIYARRAYVAIIATVLTIGLLNGILPGIIGLYFHEDIPDKVFMTCLALTNSFAYLGFATERMVDGRGWLAGNTTMWIWHCLILISAAGLLILWSALRIRIIGLKMIAGESSTNGRQRENTKVRKNNIRRVKGQPVLWKEMRQPLFGRYRKRTLILLGLALLLMVLFYLGLNKEKALDEEGSQVIFGIILMAIGFLYSTVIPATVISSEKESRTWPLLLGTVLSPAEILRGKGWGSLRHSLPAWGLLFGHVLLFTCIQILHPVGFPLLVAAMIGPVLFLHGTGLCFSTRFRRTTTAVIVNLLTAASLWGLVPILLGLMLALTNSGDDLLELVISFNPLAQVTVILATTSDGWDKLGSFHWPMERMGLIGTSLFIGFSSLLYAGLGWLFICIGRQNLRTNVF